MRRWLLFALSLLLVLAASCSSSSTTSVSGDVTTSEPPASSDATTYMETLCTGITEWQGQIETANQDFQEIVASSQTTIEDLQQGLEEFLATIAEDTEALVAEMQALGPPDVDGGDQVHETLTSGFTQAAALFQGVITDVQELDTSDPNAAGEAMMGFAGDLEEGITEVEAAFDGLENQELGQVAKEIPACDGFG